MPTRYLSACEGYRIDEDIIKADRQVLRLPTSHRETIFSHLILPNGTYFLDFYGNSTVYIYIILYRMKVVIISQIS